MEILLLFSFCRATFVDCVTEVAANALSFDVRLIGDGSVTVANN